MSTPRRGPAEDANDAIDAHLRGALRHAPDAAATPPPALSDAILRVAGRAVRGERSGGARRHEPPAATFSRLVAWLARPSVAGGLASVLVATWAGMLWWDRPLDEAIPGRHAAPQADVAARSRVRASAPAPGPDAASAANAMANPSGSSNPNALSAAKAVPNSEGLSKPDGAPGPAGAPRSDAMAEPAATPRRSADAAPAQTAIAASPPARPPAAAQRLRAASSGIAAQSARTASSMSGPRAPPPPPEPTPFASDRAAGHVDAPHAEASRAEPPRAETPRADALRADASRADASRADASRADASRADASRAEASAPGAAPANASGPGEASNGASRAEAFRPEVPRSDRPRASTRPVDEARRWAEPQAAPPPPMAAAPQATARSLARTPPPDGHAPGARPFAALRAELADRPERWRWQRDDGAPQPVDARLTGWLAALDAATGSGDDGRAGRGDESRSAGSPPVPSDRGDRPEPGGRDGRARLHLLRDGAWQATVLFDGSGVVLDRRDAAAMPRQIALDASVAARLRARMPGASR